MSEPTQSSVSARETKEIPVAIPRWGFWKGLLVGMVIEVPAIAFGVWVLARLGYGNPEVGFMSIMRLTAVFAGFAAVLTAGGVGRLAAYASIEKGGRKHATFVAARAHAAAGAGLVLIAAIPHGHLPGRHAVEWLAFPGGGLVVGAVCGTVIGVVCSGVAPVGIADVMALARRPTDALRALLDPEDLARFGAAVRERTAHFIEGMFEPAPLPPGAEDKPKEETRAPDKEPHA
jgi:hypothetical protein